MIFYPCCKINLGLDVLARRDDGFHEIETVMVPVPGLCDILEIVPSCDGETRFRQTGLTVDCPPEDNLCMKIYRYMETRFCLPRVRIHLHKIVPFGAGLGGGSSDAAYTIKGLDKIFGLGLAKDQMKDIAAQYGSDTVFFIDPTVSLCTGRGEITRHLANDPMTVGICLIKPSFGVTTKEAYAGIVPSKPEVPLTDRLSRPACQWRESITNAFEKHIFAAHPELREIKEFLYDNGAFYASMSGSGSAMFGLFDTAGHCWDDIESHAGERFPGVFVFTDTVDIPTGEVTCEKE